METARTTAQGSLDEVPVLGATDEQREQVQEVLATFEAAIGPDRVRIRSIAFRDELKGGTAAGCYDIPGRSIRVDSGAGPLDLIVRHELCHAFDHQEGLLETQFLESGGPRTFVYDPEEEAWREVETGCEEPGDLFTADGQVWRAWADEGLVVRWSSLSGPRGCGVTRRQLDGRR